MATTRASAIYSHEGKKLYFSCPEELENYVIDQITALLDHLKENASSHKKGRILIVNENEEDPNQLYLHFKFDDAHYYILFLSQPRPKNMNNEMEKLCRSAQEISAPETLKTPAPINQDKIATLNREINETKEVMQKSVHRKIIEEQTKLFDLEQRTDNFQPPEFKKIKTLRNKKSCFAFVRQIKLPFFTRKNRKSELGNHEEMERLLSDYRP